MSPSTPTTIMPTTSGRTPGSMPLSVWSPIAVYAWLGRWRPSTTPTAIPTRTATANAPTIRPAPIPRATRTQVSAMARNARNPCRTPQPIEPRIHSPRNSDVPRMSSESAAMTRTNATPMSAATCAIRAPISPASALASSTWAMTSRIAASRRTSIWARNPGGGPGVGGEPGGGPGGGGPGGGPGGGVPGGDPWDAPGAPVSGGPGGSVGPVGGVGVCRVVQGGAPMVSGSTRGSVR